MELKQPAEAAGYFQKTLNRTPNRPKAILGLARAARALGDNKTAKTRYGEFLSIWKAADSDRPNWWRQGNFFSSFISNSESHGQSTRFREVSQTAGPDQLQNRRQWIEVADKMPGKFSKRGNREADGAKR